MWQWVGEEAGRGRRRVKKVQERAGARGEVYKEVHVQKEAGTRARKEQVPGSERSRYLGQKGAAAGRGKQGHGEVK